MCRLVVALTLILVAAALARRPAEAHPNHGPSGGERYLKMAAEPREVRLVYGLTITARFARTIRSRFDQDRDGLVDEQEGRRFGRELLERLERGVTATVDGTPLELEWEAPVTIRLAGPVGSGPLAVEVTSRPEMSPGVHLVTLRDRVEFEGIYRTTANITAAPEVELLRAGRGPSPGNLRPREVFLDLPSEGPPAPRRLALEARFPGGAPPSPAPEARWGIPVGAAVGVSVLVLGVLWWRRRRRGRVTGPGRGT